MKTAVITTTIGIPPNLPDIYKNQIEHGHDSVIYWIIGDNKSPESTKVNATLVEQGIPKNNFTFISMDTQKQWLEDTYGEGKFDQYWRVFQENNYQRRIIGFLMATQAGAEKIIVVDDDNYPHPDDDFLGAHLNVVGVEDEHLIITNNLGYIDLMSILSYPDKGKDRCYVRGYPLFLRGPSQFGFGTQTIKSAVNIGLWEGSPDMSAISRVAYGDLQVSRNPNIYSIALSPVDYTSMCMQNLCFDTKYLITQYEFPMNVPIGGMTLGRYDDIWAGYICKKILDKQGAAMTFGPPQSIHKRHIHDLQKDFLQEFWGLYINDSFYSSIVKMQLDSKDAWSNFTEIIVRLMEDMKFIDPEIRKYFQRCWEDMHSWAMMVSEL